MFFILNISVSRQKIGDNAEVSSEVVLKQITIWSRGQVWERVTQRITKICSSNCSHKYLASTDAEVIWKKLYHISIHADYTRQFMHKNVCSIIIMCKGLFLNVFPWINHTNILSLSRKITRVSQYMSMKNRPTVHFLPVPIIICSSLASSLNHI